MKAILLAIVLVAFCSVSYAQERCYESVVNPYEFKNWKVVTHYPLLGANELHATLQNPDATHPVQFVETIIWLIGEKTFFQRYGYMLNGEIFVFYFDARKLCYVQFFPDKEEKSDLEGV